MATKYQHFQINLPTAPTSRVVVTNSGTRPLYLSRGKHRYAVKASTATAMKFRKQKAASTEAPDATASATLQEITGVAGASTIDMTADANILRDITFYAADATGNVLRRLDPGDSHVVVFSSAATALAGLNISLTYVER